MSDRPRLLYRIQFALCALVLCALLYQFNYASQPFVAQFVRFAASALIIYYIAAMAMLVWEFRSRALRNNDVLIKFVIIGSIIVTYPRPRLGAALIICETFFHAFLRAWRDTSTQRFFDRLRAQPALLIAGSFFTAIAACAILLSLPIATRGESIGFLHAVFTAVSATCVTGLTVVDTGSYFSVFGQCVILLFIQLGGLGIMTLSTSLAVLMGRRLSMSERLFLQQVTDASDYQAFWHMLRSIVRFTFICEGIGAVILAWRWYPDLGSLPRALFYGIFHSVSAFCNAGFALFADSLSHWRTDPITNATIAALVILGGLGFAVIAIMQRRPLRLNLHTRLVLRVSSVLLVVGTLFIMLSEYSGALLQYNVFEKFTISAFQAVTLRTAGFNTIDFNAMAPATLVLCMLWMFIGSSPGSTGGGIKTTTVGVLFATVRSMLRGRSHVELFSRTIPWDTVRKSISITFLYVIMIFFAVFMLLLLEPFSLQSILFESVSALGTVGLTLGITPHLTAAGKVVITALMFVGRIGPLTIAYLISLRPETQRFTLPEEKIMVG